MRPIASQKLSDQQTQDCGGDSRDCTENGPPSLLVSPSQHSNIDGRHQIRALLIAAGRNARGWDECQQERVPGQDRGADSGLEAPRLAHEQECTKVSDSYRLQRAAQFHQVRMLQIYGFSDRAQQKQGERPPEDPQEDLSVCLRQRALGVRERQGHSGHQHERRPDQVVITQPLPRRMAQLIDDGVDHRIVPESL